MKIYATILATVLLCGACTTQTGPNAQNDRQAPVGAEFKLYNTVADLDARLFDLGFNTCDLQSLDEITAGDFEFYHDQAGTNGLKESFIASIDTYVCNNSYRAHRRLLPETMSVFPMYRGDKLYGAIQTASHEFYAIYPDGSEQLTDTAKLFTLWIKTADDWKMRRSFSYDHISHE